MASLIYIRVLRRGGVPEQPPEDELSLWPEHAHDHRRAEHRLAVGGTVISAESDSDDSEITV